MRFGGTVALLLALAGWAHADEAPAGGRLPLVFRGMMGDVAVVEDLETTAQETVRVGETVRGAKVVRIQPTELTLEHAGKQIVLPIGDTAFAEGQLVADPSTPPCPWIVPEWARELDRTYRETRVDLDFSAASLQEVVDFLREFTGTSLHLDPEAQKRAKGTYSLTIKGRTVHEALGQLFAQFGLGLAFQDTNAVITSADKAAQNAVVKAFAAEAGLARAARILDRQPDVVPVVASADEPLRADLARIRVTATFDGASLTEVFDFLHTTTGLNFLLDPSIDPATDDNRVSAGVRSAVLRDFLDDLTRVRELAWSLREGFVYVTTVAAVEAEAEKRSADEEAAAQRAERESAVLETACALSFDGEPLHRVAARVTEATGVPIVVDPRLWGPTPKVTWKGGKTLEDFVDALDDANGVRHVSIRGTLYLLP